MINATFVGINRHRDPTIRELAGAVRDAKALWALLSDTDKAARCTLLVDGDATVANIRTAINSLAAAAADDVVILAFSGHGTKSHRLVTHDSDRSSLDTTTIGMDELAAAFKASQAKAILCIIDCCFSGGAPARVLEDSPATKDPGLPIEVLAGAGRVLIAACNTNEVAYESPSKRHGLLTAALLDVLQNGDDPVDVLALAGEVLERVRADASQLGVTQTPVFFGHVEGGLRLPRLVAGQVFRDSFPERTIARVTAKIEDLAAFGLPAEILNDWGARFPNGLNDLQLQAVNDSRVLDGQSLVVVAPTSSGKTFIGEVAAARAVADGRKTVFLLPYRALVNEKFDTFQTAYGDRLGLRVVRCNGDYTDSVGEFLRGQYDLALLTYEMFLGLMVSNKSLLNTIGLVVLDEAQFITDPSRGITVELLLTFILAAQKRGITPQLVALSAVIGDVNRFDDWLEAQSLITDKRPVPLIEGVLDRSGIFQHRAIDGSVKNEPLLSPYDIQIRKAKPGAQDVIVPLVRKLLKGTSEKVIVFRNQRGAAEGTAAYLANDLGLAAVTAALEELPPGDPSSTSESLRHCLKGGTAFHNTNLTREEKQIIERFYRDPASPLRVLGATTTIAAGINTPASTVIIAEQEFIGDEGRPFTVAEYKNMAGRAGRLGFKEEGKSILLADTSYERQRLFNKYVMGTPEPLKSSFDPAQLDTWIVRLLAQLQRVPREEVVQLLLNTYGGYLANRADPSWAGRVRLQIEALLEQMLKLGLLEVELGSVQLSLLGRACGESSLSFRSALRLVELIRGAGNISAADLMALVQALPESDGGWTPLMKKGGSENVRVSQATQRYSRNIVSLLQRYAEDGHSYVARCKRAAILADWIGGIPTDEIERAYSTTPFQGRIGYGDIRKFADATRFHLRSAHKITSVLFVDAGPSQESLDDLLKQLEDGLPADGLGLLALPVSLDRGSLLKLYRAGLRTADDVWKLDDAQLTAMLDATTTKRLGARRPRPAVEK